MRLTLHIGTEKTATTTIQHFLLHNQALLADQGIALSAVGGRGNNRKLAAFCQPRNGADDFWAHHNLPNAAARDRFFEGYGEELAAEFAEAATWADQLVLSSEHFHSRLRDAAAVTRLRDLVAPHVSEIRVLCYVREQSATVKSLYSTAVKSGMVVGFDAFSSQCAPGNPRYDYEMTGALWASVFGEDAVEFRLFDRDSLLEGDICADFLNAVDPALEAGAFARLEEDQNESLGAWGIALGQINNRINPRFRDDGAPNPISLWVRNALQASELAGRGKVAFPGAGEIHAAFDASNRAFAARFLGRDDNPFPAPRQSAGDVGALEALEPEAMLAFWESFLEQLQQAPVLSQQEIPRVRQVARRLKKGKELSEGEIAAMGRIADRLPAKKRD